MPATSSIIICPVVKFMLLSHRRITSFQNYFLTKKYYDVRRNRVWLSAMSFHHFPSHNKSSHFHNLDFYSAICKTLKPSRLISEQQVCLQFLRNHRLLRARVVNRLGLNYFAKAGTMKNSTQLQITSRNIFLILKVELQPWQLCLHLSLFQL